jgi:hypothetical protein
MPEPKHFMIMPNTEHSCITGILEAVPAIGAFLQGLLNKDDIPVFTWDISPDTGDIVATLNEHGTVHSATMWYASSCGENAWDNNTKRRDFRIAHLDSPCTCGPYVAGYCVNLNTFWKKKELEMTMVKGRRTYTAHVDTPTDGTWTAFFIDIKYNNKHAVTLNLEELRKSMKRDPSKPKSVAEQLQLFDRFPEFGGFPHDFGGFLEFTTQVSVWPNTFPYEDCSGVSCGDRLV